MDALDGLPDGDLETKPDKPKPKKRAKPKAKKKAKRPAKPKAKAKNRKVVKSKKATNGDARTERLDMRLTKAQKAKIDAKAKKTRRTVTSLVIEAIEKIR